MKHMNSRRILAMLLALCMMVGMLSMTAFADEVNAETTGSENSGEAYVTVTGSEKHHSTLTEAVNAASVDANRTVTYTIYGKVNAGSTATWIPILKSGLENVSTVKFVAGDESAELLIENKTSILAVNTNDYDVDVSFENLKLSHTPNEQTISDIGHGVRYFTCWLRNKNASENTVTYTNCEFPNGACNNQYGNTVYNNCKFSNDKTGLYNLWNYGGNTTIKGSKFTGTRGIKVYSETGADKWDKTSMLGNVSIENTSFAVTEKAAVVISTVATVSMDQVTVDESTTKGLVQKSFDSKFPNVQDKYTIGVTGSSIGGTFTTQNANDKGAEECNITAGTFKPTDATKPLSEVLSGYLAENLSVDESGTVTGGSSETAVAIVGGTSYNNLEEAFAALDGTNHTLTLTAAGETAWTYENVYWMAGGQTGSAATLKAAMTAAYAADANSITIICKPNAKIAMSDQHIDVTGDITIYANGADFCHCDQTQGRNDDLSIGTYAAPTGGKATVNVYDAKNLTVWGQPVSGRNDEWTVNLVNCENDGHGMIMYRNEADFTSKIYVTLTGCKATGYADSIVHTTADGSITITDCGFTSNCAPVNIAHKQNGVMTVTVKNTQFSNCGKVSNNNYFAPVRIVNNNETGAVNVSVDGCTFTNTVGVNGDILLGDGRTGKESHDVSLTVKNTAAKVMAQKPNYYDANGNVANGTLGKTQDVAKSEEVTTSVKTLLPTAAEGVAKITHSDGTEDTYATLADAFAAAVDGDTITLLSDCSGNGIVVKANTFMKSGLTVDFGKHTYTVGGVLVGSATTGTNAFQLNAGNKITFKNGGIVGVAENTKPAEDTPNWHGAPAIVIQNYCDLTLDSMTITGGDETVYTMSNNCGNITINNTTINAGKAKGYTSPAFAFDVYGGWYEDDVTVTVTGNSVINGDIEIERDTEKNSKNTLKLEGCTVNGTLKIGDGAVNNNMAMVTKTDATILENEVAGHKWVDGKLTLDEKYVARIGTDKYFETLEAAVAGAADDNTIVLLKDSSGNGIKVEANKFATGLTVDFGGHTYTFNGKPVGSTGSETQAAHFESGNKITLKNGTFDVDATAGANVVILVQNYADLTLDNMTLDGANVAITMLDRITLSTNNGAVTANNTKIIAPKKQENTTLFTSYAIAICGFQNYEGTSVTVTGENSTITGDIKFSKEAAADDSTYVLRLALNAGTVVGSLSFGKDLAGVTMTVTKGENVMVTPPAGYEWRNNVLVKLADAVAKTGGKSYPTLQEAVDAATDAGTVTLMADITVDKSVVINKNLTLKLSSYTITGAAGVEVLRISSTDTSTIKVVLQGDGLNGGIDGGSGGDNKAIVVGKNAELTIKSGTYTVGGDGSGSEDGEGNSTIFVEENGKVNISGGKFSSKEPWRGFYYVLNRKNGCTGTFNVKGGTFINYNPLKGDDNDGGNFCGLLYGIRTEKNEKDGSVSYIAKQGSLQVLDEDGEPVNVYKNSQLETLRTNLKDGQTVMLLSNTTLSSQMVIDKAITLDLNEKVLTSTYAKNDYAIVVKADATIKNGSISAVTHGMQANADVTIDRVKLSTTGPMGLVVWNANTSCNVKITNTEITAASHALFDYSNSNTITISHSTLKAGESGINHSGSYYGCNLTVTDSTIIAGSEETIDSNINATGVYISGSTETAKHGMQKATFTNCTIKGGTGVEVKYTDLTLDNCTVVSTYGTPIYVQNGNGAATAGFAVVSTDNATKGATPAPVGTVKITGENGKYTGYVGLGAFGKVKEDYPDFTDNTIKVSAGKFDRKLESEYCADGYEPTTEATGGYYTVKPAEGNAQLVRNGATVKYANLDVLLDEALSGDTIQLRENVTLEVGFMLEDGVCLDLNGKVLTVPYIFIAPNSTACLYDSYEITSGAGVGMLRMATKKATLSCNPSGATRFVLPVYVGTEDVSGKTYYCYRFYRAMLSYPSSSRGVTGDADSVMMEFILRFQKTEAYQYIYNEPAQLKIRLDATYFVDETSSKGLYFEFSESYSQQWAARYKDGKPQSEFTFWVKITGLSAFTGSTVNGTPSAMSNYLIASIQGTQLEYQIP